MNHSTLQRAITSGLAVLLACGTASASESFLNPGIKAVDGTAISGSAAPVRLSASQKLTIRNAFNWQGRDAELLNGVITPTTVFTEVIGLKERTNRLTVQVKNKTQMMLQVGADGFGAQQQSGDQVRGVAAEASLDWNDFQGAAEMRMIEARNRVAPSLIERFDDVDMHTFYLPAGVSAEVMAEVLMQTGDYEFVSIDWLCYPTNTVPNDPRVNLQWYHTSTRIDTYGAWDHTTGSGEIIAVCDTGVDLDHPDLQGALVSGYNAVSNTTQANGGNVNDSLNGHGTLVSGCSAGIGNNGVGISGIGWNFGIMPVRVSTNSQGTAFLSDILEGARWGSTNGAYASNCSYGGSEDPATFSSGSIIRSQGHHLVFSAGNFGLANQTQDWSTVTIVGASNSSDNWASFSHTGVGIDCIAPGVNIQSTNRFGSYENTTGTSFSSPITAGALMLVHSANPANDPAQVEAILLNACDDKQAAGEDNQTGFGRINVGRAVSDAMFGPSIVSLPFEDAFDDSALLQWRDMTGDVSSSTAASNEPSGPNSLKLSQTAQARSISVRAAEFASQSGQISFYTQHSGTESGEDLVVEIYTIFGSWQALATIPSDGVDQTEFTRHIFPAEFVAMHDDLQVRFTTSGDQADDNWFVDDVSIKFFEGNDTPWSDDFEDGISLIFDWSSSSAQLSTDGDNEPSGTKSANLDGTDTMTTQDINVNPAAAAYIHFYTQHKGVENGESLLVEYQPGSLETWIELTTIVSDGIDQSGFTLNQFTMPFGAYGPGLNLRITAQGDEANDDWYVDNFTVTDEFIVEPDPCPADINGDGELDFVDISAFLAAFGALDPIADLNGDGEYDFVDISEFLSSFGSGCP